MVDLPTRGASRRALAGATVGALLATAAGCVDLGLVADLAFPPVVPGLPSDQPWVSLPVRSWVVEGGIEARAVSACLAESCGPRAAVGMFAATGRDATEIARLLDDPTVMAGLLAGPAAVPSGTRSTRKAAPPRIEARREGALTGFSVRLARADGSRPAAGYVLARRRPGRIDFVFVISADEDAAERLARHVAPHLG